MYEARSRSPAKRYPVASFIGSTAAATHYAAGIDKSSSPPRRYAGASSPFRSSYKPSFARYWYALSL